MAETEFVTMRHPETQGVARVARRAFEKVHARKGWEIVEPENELAAQVGGEDLDSLTHEQLDQLLAGYPDVSVPSGATKPEKVALLRAAQEV